MISYLPELYEDELVYSWFARFFAHMYPSYTCALEDLLENRNMRADVEFLNRLNAGAITAITKVISLEELILKHTMFPYCRFADNSRLCNALQSMVAMEGEQESHYEEYKYLYRTQMQAEIYWNCDIRETIP